MSDVTLRFRYFLDFRFPARQLEISYLLPPHRSPPGSALGRANFAPSPPGVALESHPEFDAPETAAGRTHKRRDAAVSRLRGTDGETGGAMYCTRLQQLQRGERVHRLGVQVVKSF